MNWPTWKADLIAIAISMIIVAPFALYGPLWLAEAINDALIKADGCARPEPDGLTFPAHEAMWRGLAAKYKAELDNRE